MYQTTSCGYSIKSLALFSKWMLELTHGRRRLSEASELNRVAAIAFGEDAAAAAVAAYRNQ